VCGGGGAGRNEPLSQRIDVEPPKLGRAVFRGGGKGDLLVVAVGNRGDESECPNRSEMARSN
jgi:hypothetical protein